MNTIINTNFTFTFSFFFFFFNDTATTEIYTLSLHDALPISDGAQRAPARTPSRPRRQRPRGSTRVARRRGARGFPGRAVPRSRDRKSTRLNSSHLVISYAVFCLKKKKTKEREYVSHILAG